MQFKCDRFDNRVKTYVTNVCGFCLPLPKLSNVDVWCQNLVPLTLALIILVVHSTGHLPQQVVAAAVPAHGGVGES